ncbi:DUF4115 domain-containing protein [Candidatus Desantisbacteria bacterium]|nr:DUF4115 domain-containing protein [Candidatus Desantisbacteria bacterium]
METVGEFLRRVREQKGVPLEHIVKVTKIRETYLKAIEENNKSTLPGESYYKAFLRSYATCLGIDYEELKKQFFPETVTDKKAVRKTETLTYGKENLSKKNIKIFKIQTIYDKIWGDKAVRIGIIILLFIGGLYIMSSKRVKENDEKDENILKEEVKKESGKELSSMNPAKQDTTVQIQNIPLNSIKQAPAQEKEKTFTLTAIGIDTTWLRIKIDGKDTYELFIKPEEKKIWNAVQKFELKLGDAGGVKIKINNKDVPPLGKRGQVIDNIVFLRDKEKNKP